MKNTGMKTNKHPSPNKDKKLKAPFLENAAKDATNDLNTLKINQKYASKFDHMRRRQELEKAEAKYGKEGLKRKLRELEKRDKEVDYSGSDSSSDESDGNSADLINEKVTEKFIETLVNLRDSEKTQKLLKSKDEIFKDEDFEAPIQSKKPKEKITTYKDIIFANYENGDNEGDFYSTKYQEKDTRVEDEQKKNFLKAAKELDDTDENDGKNVKPSKKSKGSENFVDDGFLTLKKKAVNDDEIHHDMELIGEKDEDNLLEIKDLEDVQLEDVIQRKKGKVKDVDLLKRFWGDDEKLDKNERFLRNYILTEAWHEHPNKKNLNLIRGKIDKEDSENEDDFDNFEHKYNFRFEEAGGINITTHKRDQEDTYRIKDDTRTKRRKEREERLKIEKEKARKELQKVNELKKEEIMEKISKLERVAGTEKIKALAEELENEFDPEKFDKIMNKVFNDEFYQEEDKNVEEIVDAIDEKGPDYYTNSKVEFEENLNLTDDEADLGKNAGKKKETKKEKKLKRQNNIEGENFGDENIEPNGQEENGLEENGDEYGNYNYDENGEINEEDENEWWYCDECKKVIKEGKIKYDCGTCEDYTVCRDCFKTTNHVHKMKKNKVPFGAKAPKDWEEILNNMALACSECKNEITEDYYFRCEECGVDKLKICKTCKVNNAHKFHVLKKYIIPYETDREQTADPKSKLKNIVDSVFNPHYDDIIAKTLPVKFKYTSVEKDNSGISDDMLVYLNDRSLNKFMPLKRLAPYREGEKVNKFLTKKRLYDLERDLERKKKEIISTQESNENILQDNLKYVKKVKKQRTDDEKRDIKQKKRLETYGITETE